MHRHGLGADGNFDVGILLMVIEKAGHHFVGRDIGAIEIVNRPGGDLDGDVVLLLVRRRKALRWQIHFNSFHVGLAKTHHHETREKEEHDVDQRNDLDASVFFGNR